MERWRRQRLREREIHLERDLDGEREVDWHRWKGSFLVFKLLILLFNRNVAVMFNCIMIYIQPFVCAVNSGRLFEMGMQKCRKTWNVSMPLRRYTYV